MMYLLFTLIIFLNNVHASTHQQNRLCSPRRMYSRNCAHMLKTNIGNCTAEIVRNHTLCTEMDFNSNYSAHDEDQHMRLKSYCFNSEFHTLRALNITFKTGNWVEGMFRFTVLSDTHNVCVKFKVDSTNLIGNELFYDCIWYENNLDSLDVRLEYQLKSENEVYISSGNYDMYLPPCTLYGSKYNVSNIHTMVLVDQDYLPPVKLRIQKMPIIFNITEYRIKICVEEHSDDNNQRCIVKQNLNTSADDDELIVYLQKSDHSAAYYFLVEAKHKDCVDQYCFVARSPLIKLTTNNLYLYIIVSIIFVIFFVAALVYLLKSKLLVKRKTTKVLLLHDPVHSLHTNVVKILASAMKLYNIDVVLDVTDIQKSLIKDPVVWYSTAISKVEYVVVMSTPRIEPDTGAMFKDLYAIGLRFVNEVIKNKSSNLKIINTLPPYCTTDDIPPELKHFKNFKLVKQFSQMVRYLQSHKIINLSHLFHDKNIELRNDFNEMLCEMNESINKIKGIPLLNEKKETREALLQNVNNANHYESETRQLCTTCVHDLQKTTSNKQSDTELVEFVNIQQLLLYGESDKQFYEESEALLIQPNSVHFLDL